MFLWRLRCLLPLRTAAAPAVTAVFATTRFFAASAARLKPSSWASERPKLLDESEITELFVKGSGPGGQKINKTSSAVQLIHKPTGMVVKCQETRSRAQNRKIARQLMAQKLDFADNGPMSYSALRDADRRRRAASSSKKRRRKYREMVEWPEEPVPVSTRDVHGRLVQHIVEERVQGHEIMARKGKRVKITTKEGLPAFWDADLPGIYEVAREGGAEGFDGICAGVEEDDRVLVYRGYSGADLDQIAEENERAARFATYARRRERVLEKLGEAGQAGGQPAGDPDHREALGEHDERDGRELGVGEAEAEEGEAEAEEGEGSEEGEEGEEAEESKGNEAEEWDSEAEEGESEAEEGDSEAEEGGDEAEGGGDAAALREKWERKERERHEKKERAAQRAKKAEMAGLPEKYVQYLPLDGQRRGWLKVLKTRGSDEVEVLAELKVQPQTTQSVKRPLPKGVERQEHWREAVSKKKQLREAEKENRGEEFLAEAAISRTQQKKRDREERKRIRMERKEKYDREQAARFAKRKEERSSSST